MRSRALLTALIGWLLLTAVAPAPASAQGTPATADQLNRLSLEALTAPPPPAPRRSWAPSRRHSGYAYHRGGYRSRGHYARPSYGRSHGRRSVYGRHAQSRSHAVRTYGRRATAHHNAAPHRGAAPHRRRR